ncbi:MAG: histidinol-phosphate transaminase [Anaerolineales bacterium]|nr:histidinol-phosphate transaminase [Anaerolineales bacterium]
MNIADLLRPDIAAMEAYTPILPFEVVSARLGRQPSEIIKLDANENPYGPSPRVRAALANLPWPHIYPDPESTALRAALAQDTGVPAEHLLAGAGADELIDLIMRLFLQPGDRLVDLPPTFGMYSFDAAVNGAEVVRVPRRPDFSVDVEAVEAVFDAPPVGGAPPKLVFVTSPNNPDGSVLSDADLRRLLALPAGIVLDEAYVEFHGASRLGWVRSHDNLMVLRTFSKRAGLAGLRVGYGGFPLALMPHLWKIKQPYNVSVAATAAALAALADPDYLAASVARLTAERDRLAARLAEVSYLRPYPSRANFILCRVVGRDARALKLRLEQNGILVRFFNKPSLTDCLRISVGKPEHTDALLAALLGG